MSDLSPDDRQDRPGQVPPDQSHALLTLYDSALPDVYGYLYRRCGSAPLAEDLTSDTFLAAVDAVRRRRVPSLTTAWLITVARNKLVDHWRRREREQRMLNLATYEDDGDDRWDVELDRGLARETLAALGLHHRSALTLRYLDGLSVPETAANLGRTVGATEVLLVRARKAFRALYESGDQAPDGSRRGNVEEDR